MKTLEFGISALFSRISASCPGEIGGPSADQGVERDAVGTARAIVGETGVRRHPGPADEGRELGEERGRVRGDQDPAIDRRIGAGRRRRGNAGPAGLSGSSPRRPYSGSMPSIMLSTRFGERDVYGAARPVRAAPARSRFQRAETTPNAA